MTRTETAQPDEIMGDAAEAARKQLGPAHEPLDAQTTEKLQSAADALSDTESLAARTGVPEKNHEENFDELYIDVTGIDPINPGPEGVAQASIANYSEDVTPYAKRTIDGPDSEGWVERNKGIVAKDAAITNDNSGHRGYRDVKTHEPTGTYNATLSDEGRSASDQVTVQRRTPEGEVYTATLQGSNAAKATAIVANRANQRVRDAIVDRAINVANELKAGRDKEQ